MDELKNENVTEQPVAEEPVVEQRPSTKYGRTAYQQQMQEEQAAQGQPQQNQYQYWEGPQNPYQQNANQQSNERPYQQYQAQYEQPQYNAYSVYEEVKPAVKNLYAYILMGLVAATNVVNLIYNTIASRAYSMGETIEEIVDATLVIAQEPTMVVLTTISDFLFWGTVAFFVLDIIQLHRAGKKIGGAIAFAILLRPAYFIWRAHLLGQKKLVPIIYTIVVYLISFAQFGVLMSASVDMVMRTMY